MISKAKVLIATHKAYEFPQDMMYLPVQVGKSLSQDDLGYAKDDMGENISEKNRSFNELTALYWAWKNDIFKGHDICGLVHYRRYFAGKSASVKGKDVLGSDEVTSLMREYDVIVPKRRRYYVETIKDHYAHAHHKKDLDIIRQLILEHSGEYTDAFDSVMQQRSLYLYNMFLMRPALFTAYCEWVFPLLFELERRIDISDYDDYQRRVFGFLSERLFNVWLLRHDLKVKESPVVNIEGEELLRKGINMLKRKILG